jgi:riboflavin synthase
MFTGLIEALGTVHRVHASKAGKDLVIAGLEVADIEIGESIAVNGTCLTVTACDTLGCRFQAGPETLARTNLDELRPGDRVNVERSLRLGDRLGGHLVQGHVDGIGRIVSREKTGDWEFVEFSCPAPLTAQMVAKGSVAVDGISLTLTDVGSDRFRVALIPHTLAHTTLGLKRVGASVNIETDILAKYVSKYLSTAANPLASL